MEVSMSLSERIKDLQIKSNLSEREFSTKIGRGNRWLNQVITRKSKVSADDILKIEEVFNVNPMYILKGKKPVFLKG
jgi:transcriptional regulator with XRE-family HTH domain